MYLRIISSTASPNRGPLIAQCVAMLAMAAGVGLWSALLLAPHPAVAPPLLSSAPAPGQSLAPVINWFGGGSARLRISVLGLLSSGQRGTALLSINGGPPTAYSVGHTLAQGVTLAAVLPHGISIDQDGIIESITVPSPTAPPPGFVPASASPIARQ